MFARTLNVMRLFASKVSWCGKSGIVRGMTLRPIIAALLAATSAVAAAEARKTTTAKSAAASEAKKTESAGQMGLADPLKTGLMPKDTAALGKKAADAFG